MSSNINSLRSIKNAFNLCKQLIELSRYFYLCVVRAQKFFNNNIFAMFAGKLIGLISVLAIPSILNILDYTKESGTSMKAYRRYLATIYHTVTWYKDELTPGSK